MPWKLSRCRDDLILVPSGKMPGDRFVSIFELPAPRGMGQMSAGSQSARRTNEAMLSLEGVLLCITAEAT
jgi:hypothetical protein